MKQLTLIERETKTLPTFSAVGVVGSRQFGNAGFVMAVVDALRASTDFIVSGGAEGVDSWAADHAEALGMGTSVHFPDKKRPIPERFYERNTKIVEDVAVVEGLIIGISFHPITGGTRNTLTTARSAHVPAIQLWGNDLRGNLTLTHQIWYNKPILLEWLKGFTPLLHQLYPQYQER